MQIQVHDELPVHEMHGDAMVVVRGGKRYVAVIGGGPDWAAYVGPKGWTDEQVATDGDKVPREKAVHMLEFCGRHRYYRD